MLRTAVMAILEASNYSLDNSISWALTNGLKQRRAYSLLDSSGHQAASLQGLLPILQPIRASIESNSAFVLLTKAVFSIPDSPIWPPSEAYSLSSDNTHPIGNVVMCSPDTEGIVSLLLLSPAFSSLPPADLTSLTNYIATLQRKYWPSEPINLISSPLQLTSDGRLSTYKEARELGLATAVMQVSEGTLQFDQAQLTSPINLQSWNGAGVVRTFRVASDASLDSGSCSGTPTGSSGGGSGGGCPTCS